MTEGPSVLPLTEIIREFDLNAAPRKKRLIAPGELELGLATGLQFLAGAVLLFASPVYLAGHGTALLTFASRPELSTIIKVLWAVVFVITGILGVRALLQRNGSIQAEDARKLAWQVIIPLWTLWLSGLVYPLFVGLPTNLIVLGAVSVLVIQWFGVRILVPADSDWYSREVSIGRHLGEGS